MYKCSKCKKSISLKNGVGKIKEGYMLCPYCKTFTVDLLHKYTRGYFERVKKLSEMEDNQQTADKE